MIKTQEEVKLFEQRFKGSLDKLDEFERQWSDFKVTHVPLTANANTLSASKLYEKDFSLQIIGKINSSFDSGFSSMPEPLQSA